MIKKNIGLFGFGCVGEGFYKLLIKSEINAEITKICVKNKSKKRSYEENWVYDQDSILEDQTIDIVVELIDDAEAALDIVTKALKSGKHVVSANKKMIAENLNSLLELEKEAPGTLYYEGAVCGSIPILSTIRNYLHLGNIERVFGIFNGSTNYILTRVNEEGLTYEEALSEAKKNGFAESDPSLDTEGFDPSFKLAILIQNIYGITIKPTDILKVGITKISAADVQFARDRKLKIKLITYADKAKEGITAWVIPKFISEGSHLAGISNEYNSVILESEVFGQQTLSGKGAGMLPTGLAVLADVSTIFSQPLLVKRPGVSGELNGTAKIEIYVGFQSDEDVKWQLFESVKEKSFGKKSSYAIGNISINNLKKLVKTNSQISVIHTSGTGREFQTNGLAYRNKDKSFIPAGTI